MADRQRTKLMGLRGGGVLVVLLLAGWVHGQQSGVVPERIRVRTMVGEVSVRSPKAKKWRSARVGMPVRAGWDIRTFVESSVELEYQSGTILKVGESSVVTIAGAQSHAKLGATRSSVKIATGDLWANVKKLTSKQSKFEFETPTAVASIRGTRLGLSVDEQGATRLDVYEGTVMFQRRGSSTASPVTNRMRAIARPDRDDLEVVDFREAGADSAEGEQPPMIDPFVGDTIVPGRDGGEADSTGADTAGAGGGAAADSGAADSVVADSVAADTSADTSASVPDTAPIAPAADSAAAATPADTVATDGPEPTEEELDGGALLEILYPGHDAVMTETPVVVTGRTRPRASAVIGSGEVAVGADGLFAGPYHLEPGTNTIRVEARTERWEQSREVTVRYRPPLHLTVNNLVDNMEVTSARLEVDLEVSPGASFSVNGVEGRRSLELRPGENTITVRARDEWGGEEEREFTVVYRPTTDFVLNIVRPAEGDTVREPMIPVSGSTAPGARVTANAASVSVGPTGFFTHRVMIPDEPGEYEIEIVAELHGEELTDERTVVYQPRRAPLSLVVSAPADGQAVRDRAIRVRGITNPRAELSVGDRPLRPTATGSFSLDIAVSERDIGDYTLDIVARDDEDEISRSINLTIDVTSSRINTSPPSLRSMSEVRQATRHGDLALQVLDPTPDDEISVEVSINGAREEMVVDPGATERIALDEGRNDYSIVAFDRAGNRSNVLQGTVYYLPGPLNIDIIEPSANPLVIRGLPPMPGGVDAPVVEIEVEIDDGVGDVPEAIRRVVLRGEGNEIVLQEAADYVYEGEVELAARRRHTFTIEVEDLTGTVETRDIVVLFAR